jgi:cysteine sulfinate desulfinase/cysteine desulfurase-like protein
MGVPKDLARSSLRLSLGAHTTQEDLDLALPRLAHALAQSRRA